MIPCGNFSRFFACSVAVLNALYASEIIFPPFNLAELLARSRRKIVFSRRDLRDITNLAEFSSRFFNLVVAAMSQVLLLLGSQFIVHCVGSNMMHHPVLG